MGLDDSNRASQMVASERISAKTCIYMQQVMSWFRERTQADTEKLTGLYAAFETGNATAITEHLNDQLLDTVSFYDARESFYHGFLLALLSTCANWRVSSNAETGKGRATSSSSARIVRSVLSSRSRRSRTKRSWMQLAKRR